MDDSFRETLCRDFPMRELLTIISRDISYAYTVCQKSIHSALADPDGKKGAQYYEEAENVYARLRKNMLFPIEWTTSREKPYSLDRESNPLYERQVCEMR